MKKLPNSRHCFVCGLENEGGLQLAFYIQPDGTVECTKTVDPRFEGYPGLVHGGVVMSMLDEALGRAFMLDDPERFMYTAKLTTRFRKHVPVGQPLRIVGRAVKDRGRTGEAEAFVYGPQGDLLVEAQGLLVGLPEEDLQGANLQELGWKVYPDTEETP